MKICIRCKLEKPLIAFGKRSSSKDGLNCYCKTCKSALDKSYASRTVERRKEYYRQHVIEKMQYDKIRKQTPVGKYGSYKVNAKSHGIFFALTMEEFLSFWAKPCSYCQTPIKTIGIDRVNNTKGYIMENCVSCCRRCNIAKNDMSLETFSDWITSVYNHFEQPEQIRLLE